MHVVGIITARGGSKGVPRKNLALLGGRSLLRHTAECARASRRLGRILVTTDDESIAAEARRCGLEVPFRRPADLAQDDTPTLPVLQHAVRWLEHEGDRCDAVCLLQPTHPFRRAAEIDACIDLLQEREADSVITVLPVPDHYNPHWVYFADAGGNLRLSTGEAAPIPRRQELPPAFHREGSVYVVRREVLMQQNSLYGRRMVGLPVDPRHRVNIDSPLDLERAEQVLQQWEACS